jgi:hypothetical protein
LDDLERILSYVDAGPNFSNPMLQALLVMVNKPPKVQFHLHVFLCAFFVHSCSYSHSSGC